MSSLSSSSPPSFRLHCAASYSIASTEVATAAVQSGARLITHLFNAMPQLHHRDPSIIGLLGASPHLSSPSSPTSPVSATFPRTSALHRVSSVVKRAAAEKGPQATSEAFDDVQTPPQTPVLRPQDGEVDAAELGLQKGKVADLSFERPFYELIVDGIHSHPNSVRVRGLVLMYDEMGWQRLMEIVCVAACVLVVP